MIYLRLLLFCLFPWMVFSQAPKVSNAIDFLRLNSIEGELDNQYISSIMQDREGFIWIGTQDGLYKFFETNTKSYHYNPQKHKSLPANWVRAMVQDSEGIFWIGTQGEGLIRFDQDTEEFEKIDLIEGDTALKGMIIYDLFITSKDVLWIESENALYRKTISGPIEKINDLGGNIFINETSNGQIVLAFNNTIYVYHESLKELEPVYQAENITKMFQTGTSNFILKMNDDLYTYTLGQSPVLLETPEIIYGISNMVNHTMFFLGKTYMYEYHVLNQSFKKLEMPPDLNHVLGVLQALFVDRQGILWIGTNNGLYKESIAGRLFKHVISVHARRIIPDGEKLFIVGRDGLFEYEKETNTLKNLIPIRMFSAVKTSHGIWTAGLTNKLYQLDAQGMIKTHEIPSNNKNLFKIYGIVQDKNEFLWVSSWEGLHLVNLKGEVLRNFIFKNENGPYELKGLQLKIDKNDNLWIITVGNGIYKIPEISKVSSNEKPFDYEQFTKEKPKKNTLNTNTAYEIFEADTGEIWFGMDSGINIYNPESRTFRSFKIGNDFFDKKTMAINSNAPGIYWISTIRNGIYVYDAIKDRLINFNASDGLVSNACLFTSRLFYKNEFYFGTEKGIQVIAPKGFKFPEVHTKPVITEVDLYSKTSKSDTKFEIDKQNIKHTDHFDVHPNQSYFTIHFATNDYSFPKKLNYYYKLNDENSLWHEAESNFVSFTNLESGNYTFYVKAAYNILDDTPIASKQFTINAPWYKKTTAYVAYGLIFIAIIFSFYVLKLNQNMALNKLKAAKSLDEFKTKLYTNISHEFRTPLTLISGPIDNQLAKSDLSKTDKKELTLVKQNANRLLNLVNQMLDLSMIDSGQIKLKVAQGNLAVLLKQIISAFQYKAKEKNIEISFHIHDLKTVWFDKDIIEKVSSNLLSNAIKYAPKNSKIIFEAMNQKDMLVMSIINNSKQVGKEDLTKLFQRFYQNNELSDGVGVGLALVRDLVSLSKGTIIANNLDANRIQFTVTLPISKEAFNENEILVHATSKKQNFDLESVFAKTHTEKPSILIVEDEPDIRAFIVSMFLDSYRVMEAANGKIGIEKAKKQLPDLIISDIMMPEQDGMALCHEIKTNELTSHIPVILLTAKVGEVNEIQGIKTGADAYVTKPFSSEKLKVRVEKLIESRLKLQKHFSSTLTINPELAITSTETEFLKRLQTTLDKHITNPDFNSEALGKHMQISRTQLHRKLKAITGMTTSEFLRSQRLKLSVELLKKSDATMAEIAYQVGFNSPSYFNKCFKEIYGCTPQDYSLNP
ncbi:MAG: hybrid sensor histidine kinase/response regulator [Xanthomarina sp.]|uniref:response regulator n=1 Tax=Xanthomarina sp. TaxID=1931211 RepID=UPI000C60EFC9|nr:hybrid sensor histidine kinase/response regulator transcription factor [Xanthomarina sp.]MAL23074.1 hybrid sensor histidine kinase/response regulator [Xanthomarina sp.]MBF61745.1 hybrid sensor histidine kinase/response regulator [Xanthomarina sp.]